MQTIAPAPDNPADPATPYFASRPVPPEVWERIFQAAHARHDEAAAEWAARRGLTPAA